jgi:hypothetical protein
VAVESSGVAPHLAVAADSIVCGAGFVIESEGSWKICAMTWIVFATGSTRGFPVEVNELFWDEDDARNRPEGRHVTVFTMRVLERCTDCPAALQLKIPREHPLVQELSLEEAYIAAPGAGRFADACREELWLATELAEMQKNDEDSRPSAPRPSVIWGIGPEDPASDTEVYVFYESEKDAQEHVRYAYGMLVARPFTVH